MCYIGNVKINIGGDNLVTQFKKGVLELCVLSLISKKDCYGYEIAERISTTIELSEGTLYPLLRRLTKEEYCITYLKESSFGPSRKYYSMTIKGKERYLDLRRQWLDFSSQVSDILDMEVQEK